LLGGAKSAGDFITGPGKVTYKIKALSPGQFYFRRDIHPTTMVGTFIVAGGH